MRPKDEPPSDRANSLNQFINTETQATETTRNYAASSTTASRFSGT